jgi:hypothetical protein
LEIFGWQIARKPETPLEAFAPEERDDGAVVVNAGGVYGHYIDVEGSVKTDAELIQKYREIAIQPEVELAIDDICNEAIVNEPEEPQVKIILDELEQPDNIKKMIETEFTKTLELLEFHNQSYEIFKRWYIDGRSYYHMIIDPEDVGAGVKELRWIDARKIRKVREVARRKSPRNANVVLSQTVNEYYVYNEKGFAPAKPGQFQPTLAADNNGLKISKDSIAYVTSGLTNANNDVVLSHLHKAMKPLNQLKAMEDSLVIYRISRAPERRVFYVDVGNLPKALAEQHVKDLMTKFKNKVVYDASTGEIRDDRKFMTMLEDFWMPRRGEGKGTEITTLQGGQNLSQIDDIEYFRKLLYQSLNVPVSRMEADAVFNLGRSTEISRDEVKFHKFIGRLRLKFQQLFTIILGKQLILKGICTEDDWKQFSSKVAYQFAQDNFFAELKEIEITRERIMLVTEMDPFAGKYYSHEWIRKNVLRQTDKEIEEQDKLIEKEMDMDQYMQSFLPQEEAEMSKPVNN